jgi:hypothetical protein
MEVEDGCYEQDGKQKTAGNSPSELKPDGIDVDFLADPFALDVSPIEIVRKERKQRAEK